MARTFSTSPRRLSSPTPADQPGPSKISPKISPLVDQISTLTLLEVSELVTALKERLNITEIAMPSSAPAAAAPAASEAPVEEKPKEKTIFVVKLEKIDPAQKAKVIREVKAMMPNMNLVEVSLGSFSLLLSLCCLVDPCKDALVWRRVRIHEDFSPQNPLETHPDTVAKF